MACSNQFFDLLRASFIRVIEAKILIKAVKSHFFTQKKEKRRKSYVKKKPHTKMRSSNNWMVPNLRISLFKVENKIFKCTKKAELRISSVYVIIHTFSEEWIIHKQIFKFYVLKILHNDIEWSTAIQDIYWSVLQVFFDVFIVKCTFSKQNLITPKSDESKYSTVCKFLIKSNHHWCKQD